MVVLVVVLVVELVLFVVLVVLFGITVTSQFKEVLL